MASGKGTTFKLGKMMVNLSGRGVATKDSETGEIRRYPFPWTQAPQQTPPQNNQDQYEEDYPPEEYEGQYDEQEYEEPEYDENGGEYYAPEDEDEDQYDGGILDSVWLMWAALILLPPLGILLLWRSNRYEYLIRGIISVASLRVNRSSVPVRTKVFPAKRWSLPC